MGEREVIAPTSVRVRGGRSVEGEGGFPRRGAAPRSARTWLLLLRPQIRDKKWGSETERIALDVKAGRFGKGRTLNYANRVRGALVAYKQRDMEAGGRGTHIRDIPSVASAEAAQRLLQPPRAAGAARRSSSGPGAALGHPRAALGRPTSKPRAATAKPCPLRGDGRRWKETHRAPDFNSNFFTNLSKERQSQ